MKKEKKKDDFVDDNHTVANMNVDGFSWYKSEKHKKTEKELGQLGITRSERRAMIWGAYKAYLPMLGVMIGGMCLVYWLLYLLMKLT